MSAVERSCDPERLEPAPPSSSSGGQKLTWRELEMKDNHFDAESGQRQAVALMWVFGIVISYRQSSSSEDAAKHERY